jgi:predicted TIM-barrel fold metal-dependent hydrolase
MSPPALAPHALDRRSLLLAAAALPMPAQVRAAPAASAVPMVDTHIHLFDPTRPQGAPYRGPRGHRVFTEGASPALYRTVMQADLPVAAIHVDASPWVEDNLWVLQAARQDPIMVGVIGNLRIEAADFASLLERHAKWPLLRGLRYGNLWRYDLVAQVQNPGFIDGVRRLAAADLVLDTANPRLDLLGAVIRLSDAVPDLRIVIDHLPKLDPAPAEMADFERLLREIGQRPRIFVKLSSSIREANASPRLADHRARLDLLCGHFGPDRILFASDWPNVEGAGPVQAAVAIARQYFSEKPRAEQEKFFWRNAAAVYKFQPRTDAQRQLLA